MLYYQLCTIAVFIGVVLSTVVIYFIWFVVSQHIKKRIWSKLNRRYRDRH